MAAVRVSALCVVAAMMCAMLRKQHPEMAGALALATGAAVLVMLSGELRQAVEAMLRLANRGGMSEESGALLLRAAGIALIAEFAAQMCEDAGERAMGGRIALAARVAMLALSAPLLTQLMDVVSEALL